MRGLRVVRTPLFIHHQALPTACAVFRVRLQKLPLLLQLVRVQPEVVSLQHCNVLSPRPFYQIRPVLVCSHIFLAQGREDNFRISGGILPDNLWCLVLGGIVSYQNFVLEGCLLGQNAVQALADVSLVKIR